MKSHVGLETKLCPVCYKTHETGALLIDMKLTKRFERHAITGFDLCEEHAKMSEEYIALVETLPPPLGVHVLSPENATPTGAYAHIRRSAWSKVFNTRCPDLPMVYVDQGVLEHLQKMTEGSC